MNLKRRFYDQQLKNWDGKEQHCSFIEEKLKAAYKLKYRVKMYESNNQIEDKGHIVGIVLLKNSSERVLSKTCFKTERLPIAHYLLLKGFMGSLL